MTKRLFLGEVLPLKLSKGALAYYKCDEYKVG